MKDFLSDLKDIVGPGVLARVLLKMRENDLLGLAGQLTYFFCSPSFPSSSSWSRWRGLC
jgi:membrane protein